VWTNPEDAEGNTETNTLLIVGNGTELLMTIDGRVVRPSGCPSLWKRYMAGEGLEALVSWAEKQVLQTSEFDVLVGLNHVGQ
jgi:hypothetical protein